MSCEIIKGIYFKGDQVFIRSAPSNVTPRVYIDWSEDSYNEIYRQNGFPAVLKEVAKNAWTGRFRFQDSKSASKYVRALAASFDALSRHNPELKYFLDPEHGAELISGITARYFATHTFSPKDFASYEAMRSDSAAVLEMCKESFNAFHYASESVQSDRETAKAYITSFCDKPQYLFPLMYRLDAMIADASAKQAQAEQGREDLKRNSTPER